MYECSDEKVVGELKERNISWSSFMGPACVGHVGGTCVPDSIGEAALRITRLSLIERPLIFTPSTMFDTLFGYFGYRNMSRSPVSPHPLSTDSEAEDAHRIWDNPRNNPLATAKQSLPSPEQEVTSVRTKGSVRSRRSTPTPTRTPTPGLSTSASQVALKRTESSRRVDSPERRIEPARKRRYTDEEQLRASVTEKAKENSLLSQQLFATRNDLADAIRKNQASQQRIQNILEEKSTMLTALQSYKKDWEAREQEAARKIRELEASNKRKDEELRMVQAKLRSAEEKQAQLTKLLEVRTADLNGAQTFLTTADAYSGADVIAMTEALNSEIFQTAAYMAELIEDGSMQATPQERSKLVEKYGNNLERYVRREVGEGLWGHLQSHYTNIRTEPLPLQLAFQSILTRWCGYHLRTFTLGSFGDFLEKLYQRIRDTETQPIAGRWRAITSGKIASFKEATSVNLLVDSVLSMLYFCGWSPASEQSKKSLLSVQHMVFAIEKLMTQLKAATKEGITTVDMEAFVVSYGSPLSSDMEDVYAENGGSQGSVADKTGKRVLCTVGLGLRRTIVKRNEAEQPEHRAEILLKTKVALTSVLSVGA
ncbi:hypothetical protein HYPSUDRAFT_782802 [Hypholoma sublateritium FD-334 SS-4]|uniref:Uncharacterized protein n=1 Tax=Hypholoma sublateritium (strain FD-334 SS-4) TaxID=945553 RepID=A0A0D2L1R5_HYPSF|nr:hypothetical protein HYPSUDRAFT_782802 [Hypholoma sublateritium FD-334 SS-4]